MNSNSEFKAEAYRAALQILEYEMPFHDLAQCEVKAAVFLNRAIAVGIDNTFYGWNPGGKTQPQDRTGDNVNSTCLQALNNIFSARPQTTKGRLALSDRLTHFNHNVIIDQETKDRLGRPYDHSSGCQSFLTILPSDYTTHDEMFTSSCPDYGDPLDAQLAPYIHHQGGTSQTAQNFQPPSTEVVGQETTSSQLPNSPIVTQATPPSHPQTKLTTCQVTADSQKGEEGVNVRDNRNFVTIGVVLNGRTVTINQDYLRDGYVWMASGVAHDGRPLSGWVWREMLNCN